MIGVKRSCLLMVAALIIAQASSAWGDSFSSSNKKGTKAYERAEEHLEKGEKEKAAESLEQALRFYRDAEIENPESPELSYNLGNVMHQQEKYQDALERYYRALSSDEIEHQAFSHYNLGNTFYRSGKYPEAIQASSESDGLTL